MKEIKAIVKEPGKQAEVRLINPDIVNIIDIIGGYVESNLISADVLLLVDEEGRLKDLPYNCTINGYDYCGTMVFVGIDNDSFADVPSDFGFTYEVNDSATEKQNLNDVESRLIEIIRESPENLSLAEKVISDYLNAERKIS